MSDLILEPKVCADPYCRTKFTPKSIAQKFCTEQCRERCKKRKQREREKMERENEGGKPPGIPKYAPDVKLRKDTALELYHSGLSIAEIAKQMGTSYQVAWQYVSKFKQQDNNQTQESTPVTDANKYLYAIAFLQKTSTSEVLEKAVFHYYEQFPDEQKQKVRQFIEYEDWKKNQK